MRCGIVNAGMRAILRNNVMTYLMVIITKFPWKSKTKKEVKWTQDSDVSLFMILHKDKKLDSNGTSVLKENAKWP
jgi:hypothetical protein